MDKMERMEQIMIEDNKIFDRKVEGLERYNFRIMILKWLLQLSDLNYQKREWTGGEYWYDSQFSEAYVFLIEECEQMEQALNKQNKKIACNAIGLYLRNEEEALAMYDFVMLLEEMSENIGQRVPNKYYLESPYLPKMIESANLILRIFLANERGDKELVDYLEEYKKEKGIKIDLIY